MAIAAPIRRHPVVTALSLLIAVPLVVFTLWATITVHLTYADGYRAGFLQKISKKGWLCKTWEGELQITAIPGAAPEIFLFTVRSDSIASVLNQFAGQRVVINYQQHKGVPSSCFGDTEYYVTGVRAVASP